MALQTTEPDLPRGRVRVLLRRLALVLASLVVTSAILEVGATWRLGERFVRGAELGNSWKIAGRFDPLFGWSGRPHARGRVVSSSTDYSVALNSEGFRDPPRSRRKPPGAKRVLALGDSVTWGWGVQAGARFSDLLEQGLGPDVEVLNLGCPGYGTDQEYWTLVERGLEYEPDLVLVCFIINDILEVQDGERYGMRKPRYVRGPDGAWSIEGRPVEPQDSPLARSLRRGWRALVSHSALLTLATRRAVDPPEAGPTRKRRYEPPSAKALAQVRAISDQLIDATSVTRHAMTLLRDACAERGLPLLFTYVPHGHDEYVLEPLFPLPDDLGPQPFRTYTTRRLEEACAALDVPLVTVDDRFLAACRAGARLRVADGHANAAGHRIVAEALLPVVREMLSKTD